MKKTPATRPHVRPFLAFVSISLALLVFSTTYYYAITHDDSWLMTKTYVPRPSDPYEARTISIAEETPYAVISGSYPRFPKASEEFNTAIANTVRKSVLEHKLVSEENWKARSETGTSPTQPTADERFTFVSEWTAVTHTKDYASVVIRHGGYSGGAHGSYTISTFTYDYARGRMLTIADMFPAHPAFLKKISVYTREYLKESLAEKMDGTMSDVSVEMLHAGTEPTIENFSTFTIAPDASHITIYFGLYQVAAYVFGEQAVDVDLPTNNNIEPAWLE